jgi:hypothetical protein
MLTSLKSNQGKNTLANKFALNFDIYTWLTWRKLGSDQKCVKMVADEAEPEELVVGAANPVTVHLLFGR